MEQKPNGTACKRECEELGNIQEFAMKGSREIWDSWIARMGLREGFFFFIWEEK